MTDEEVAENLVRICAQAHPESLSEGVKALDLDSELPFEQREIVEEHLRECEWCRRLLSELEVMRSAFIATRFSRLDRLLGRMDLPQTNMLIPGRR